MNVESPSPYMINISSDMMIEETIAPMSQMVLLR
jgi:hypothetical protein